MECRKVKFKDVDIKDFHILRVEGLTPDSYNFFMKLNDDVSKNAINLDNLKGGLRSLISISEDAELLVCGRMIPEFAEDYYKYAKQ